jgi:hypothetical protein
MPGRGTRAAAAVGWALFRVACSQWVAPGGDDQWSWHSSGLPGPDPGAAVTWAGAWVPTGMYFATTPWLVDGAGNLHGPCWVWTVTADGRGDLALQPNASTCPTLTGSGSVSMVRLVGDGVQLFAAMTRQLSLVSASLPAGGQIDSIVVVNASCWGLNNGVASTWRPSPAGNGAGTIMVGQSRLCEGGPILWTVDVAANGSLSDPRWVPVPAAATAPPAAGDTASDSAATWLGYSPAWDAFVALFPDRVQFLRGDNATVFATLEAVGFGGATIVVSPVVGTG